MFDVSADPLELLFLVFCLLRQFFEFGLLSIGQLASAPQLLTGGSPGAVVLQPAQVRRRLQVLSRQLLQGRILKIVIYHIPGPPGQKSNDMYRNSVSAKVPGAANPEGMTTEQVPATLPGERQLKELNDELNTLDNRRLVGGSTIKSREKKGSHSRESLNQRCWFRAPSAGRPHGRGTERQRKKRRRSHTSARIRASSNASW